jgi:hypothetical protein
MTSRIQFVSGIVVAGLLVGSVMAAPKKEGAVAEKTLKGVLSAKPADAAANIAAVLTVKAKGGNETAYNVIAKDEAVAGKITALLAGAGNVVIKGVVSEDGKSVTASDAMTPPVKAAGGEKPKGVKIPANHDAPAAE